MDGASSSTSGTQNRQKRVLPSRSRRGGPGVGTCEVDILILETLKRRSENEPLIPANTSFILTTNSKYASDDPGGTITVNTVANDRYFDRPEVVKAFREQAIIQTPEFSSIGESSNVGGRFRPRAAEDDGAETSDATYEKRHRKFETFEKRQRLREKEKLKHEHYKMKERLEQLRAMDGAAFMALPASFFSPMSKEAVTDLGEISAMSSPYTNLNGYVPHVEGERRRKEMMNVATMLEERYRVLLPSDRIRRATEPALSESASRSQVQSRDGDDSETDQASVVGEKLRLRLPARSSTSTTPAPSLMNKQRPSISSKQSSVIRVLRATVSTPSPPRAEPSPLSPSPTIDMDISSREPTPSPPSPLPQTPISNQASMVKSSSRDVLPSNYAAEASGIVSGQQNFTFSEQRATSALLEEEIPVMPPEQELQITLNEQESSPASSDQERPTIPELDNLPSLRSQEKPIHDQGMLPTPPEQERFSMLEPDRRPASLVPEDFITQYQERLPSPPAPVRSPTPLEREKSNTPECRRSPTPLARDQSVTPEQEILAAPPEREKSVAPERLPTPEWERMTETERLPTSPVPERPTTPLVDVTDQTLQDNLPEDEPSIRKPIEPRVVDDRESENAETRDKMSEWAESEAIMPQNEPEKVETDVESEADKMHIDVEQDATFGPIPTVAVTEHAATTGATMNVIPDATTVFPDMSMAEASPASGPTFTEANVTVFEVGPDPDPDQLVTSKKRLRTESVEVEKFPSPTPISSISAPRGRGRKRARLSVQPNETVSAPVRVPRVPKNHVTYIGASGEIEVTASAIIKAAVHRTQRDVKRHLNAFGAPLPNVIIQIGPPFELPEWVFPPLSPAESEHAYGDLDAIEDLELDPKEPSERQATSSVQADLEVAIEADRKGSMEPDGVETNPKEPVAAASTEVDPVEPILQPTRQSGRKNKTPLPWPPPEHEIDEDSVFG